MNKIISKRTGLRYFLVFFLTFVSLLYLSFPFFSGDYSSDSSEIASILIIEICFVLILSFVFKFNLPKKFDNIFTIKNFKENSFYSALLLLLFFCSIYFLIGNYYADTENIRSVLGSTSLRQRNPFFSSNFVLIFDSLIQILFVYISSIAIKSNKKHSKKLTLIVAAFSMIYSIMDLLIFGARRTATFIIISFIFISSDYFKKKIHVLIISLSIFLGSILFVLYSSFRTALFVRKIDDTILQSIIDSFDSTKEYFLFASRSTEFSIVGSSLNNYIDYLNYNFPKFGHSLVQIPLVIIPDFLLPNKIILNKEIVDASIPNIYGELFVEIGEIAFLVIPIIFFIIFSIALNNNQFSVFNIYIISSFANLQRTSITEYLLAFFVFILLAKFVLILISILNSLTLRKY